MVWIILNIFEHLLWPIIFISSSIYWSLKFPTTSTSTRLIDLWYYLLSMKILLYILVTNLWLFACIYGNGAICLILSQTSRNDFTTTDINITLLFRYSNWSRRPTWHIIQRSYVISIFNKANTYFLGLWKFIDEATTYPSCSMIKYWYALIWLDLRLLYLLIAQAIVVILWSI